MAHSDDDYTHTLSAFEQEILKFLRAFETIQEDLRLGGGQGSAGPTGRGGRRHLATIRQRVRAD